MDAVEETSAAIQVDATEETSAGIQVDAADADIQMEAVEQTIQQ